MIRLDKALRAWGTPDFDDVLRQEVAQLGDQLPLQQALSIGSYVTADPVTVVINGVTDAGSMIRVKAGVFYQSVIAGCSCEGDPTPTSENTEYCEIQLDIDKTTAETAIVLAA